MTDAKTPATPERRTDPPAAVVRESPRRVSLAWVVPALVVVFIVGIVMMQASRARGPRIEIVFDDGAGLDPGAELVHRGLRVGVVRAVELTPDLSRVRVTAELAPHASGLAREGARFWIVRPEVSFRRVAGLETLLGPRYIAVQAADADAPRARRFEGLPDAPPAPEGVGLVVTLRAERAGAVTPGSPVLFRGMRVGAVRGLRLADDGASVEIIASVRAPYDRLVRDNSRWWASGGVGVDFGLFRGLTVEAESLDKVIQGSVSFATPNRPGARVEGGAEFRLEPEVRSDWLEWDPSIPPELPDPTVGAG